LPWSSACRTKTKPHKELADEQAKQTRLRYRLATADLRLSVVLAATDAGDQGLIALRACQAYAKEVSTPK